MTEECAREHMLKGTPVLYTDKDGEYRECCVLWVSYSLVGIYYMTEMGIKNVVVSLEELSE